MADELIFRTLFFFSPRVFTELQGRQLACFGPLETITEKLPNPPSLALARFSRSCSVLRPSLVAMSMFAHSCRCTITSTSE